MRPISKCRKIIGLCDKKKSKKVESFVYVFEGENLITKTPKKVKKQDEKNVSSIRANRSAKEFNDAS